MALPTGAKEEAKIIAGKVVKRVVHHCRVHRPQIATALHYLARMIS
jgi:hypothetical protein